MAAGTSQEIESFRKVPKCQQKQSKVWANLKLDSTNPDSDFRLFD